MKPEKQKGDFKELGKIDKENLDLEFTKFTADYSYYSYQFSIIYTEELKAKARLERIEFLLYKKYRKELGKADKKFTEKLIESSIRTDNNYILAEEEWLKCRERLVYYSNLLKVLDKKKDMLISLGAQMRAELSAKLTISEKRIENGN